MVLPYLLLSGLIMGPLLQPGFVLTMDMVFTPQLRMPDHVDNTFLLYAGLHVLNMVVPADVLQKILLMSVFVASGFGMYRLLVQRKIGGSLAAHVGGILYTFNPFVYDRLMAGQYGVLLGYAFLPWFTAAVFAFLRRPAVRQAVVVAAWLIAISIVSIHAIGFALIVMAGLVWFAWPDIQNKKQMVKLAAIIGGIFIIASSYWLVPTFLGQGRIADSVQTFSGSQRQAFMTADTNGDTSLGAVLGLQGFWQDTRDLYILPIDFTPQWGLVRLGVWMLIGLGVWRVWRKRAREAKLFVWLGAVAIIFALGIVSDALAAFVPFFAGYREPQKFAMILALSYGYFAAWGAQYLFERAARWRVWAQYGVVALLVVLILAYTSPLLWGAQGQLRAAAYPADWQAINNRLTSDKEAFSVLYLPWHLYMGYDFAGRIVASPAPDYFDKPVIVSDNPELDGVAPQFYDATKQAVSQTILPAIATGRDVAPLLRQHNIRYVLIAKELDYTQYDNLRSQPHATLVMQTEHFYLYQVK